MSEPNGDKRSVATDALETLGMIIGPEQKRDAIHLAVEPVQAGEKLYPGQDINLVNGLAMKAVISEGLGIVDPFLKHAVLAGERFWLVVYPRQIHSLRHVWTHPAFPNAPELADLKAVYIDRKSESEAWLRKFCKDNDVPNYDFILKAVEGKLPEDYTDEGLGASITEDYFNVYGTDAHSGIPPEFWDHLENITGKKMDVRPDHFSCSC